VDVLSVNRTGAVSDSQLSPSASGQDVRIWMVNTSQFDAKSDEVNHWTPSSHWCARCWHWVVDCEHLLDPLPLEHHAVDDGWIQSLAYDRVTQCLEVRFKRPWHNVHQYRPVPLQVVPRSENHTAQRTIRGLSEGAPC
jgi:hypothetical protein